jgi:hypothetical protein
LLKWTIVRPSCFSPKADHVAHGFKTKKKKEYKDDFFKNNIDSVAMQPRENHRYAVKIAITFNAFTDLKQFSFIFFFRSFRHCVL